MVDAVPEQLWLLESFLNSIDVESGQDDLDSLPRFARWLRDHGRAVEPTADDLEVARTLRAELRAELCCHHHGGTRDREALDAMAARVPLAARFAADGSVRLEPAGRGAGAVLGEVLAAAVRGAYEGTWPRLKICSADSCRVVYYDRSKNASRRWCSMGVCGNREKTRAYRNRQRLSV